MALGAGLHILNSFFLFQKIDLCLSHLSILNQNSFILKGVLVVLYFVQLVSLLLHHLPLVHEWVSRDNQLGTYYLMRRVLNN